MRTDVSKPMFNTQMEDLKAICKETHWANFSEMGAGKSLPHAILARGVIEDAVCDRVIIVAPRIVLGDWMKIFRNWLNVPDLVRLYRAPKKIRPWLDLREIVVVSYETFVEDIEVFKVFAKAERTMLVIDEAHKLRNQHSNRTQVITEYSRLCKRVYLLTGTPITNGIKNAYTYIDMLRPQEYYGSYKGFLMRHCRGGRTRGMSSVQEILDSFSVRHLKKEMLDLPPVTFTNRKLDWAPGQRGEYKRMLLEPLSLGLLTRLHKTAVAGERWQAISEDLESIDLKEHKVVILCHYRDSIKKMRELLKEYNPAVLYGETSNIEREKEKFDLDPSCRVMIAHPLSAGVGVNFTVASYMIFFEYSWDLDCYDQTVSRCNRPGQTETLTVINYVLRGSLEERIIKRLIQKKAFATSILNDPEEFIEFVKLEEDEDDAE